MTAASRPASDRAAAIRAVVGDVIRAAVSAAGADGVVALEDWTPEGELVYEWLVSALGETRVWRGSALASNVHGVDAEEAQLLGTWRFARQGTVLLAHPACRTALLLGGQLPRADLFPLGDLSAVQVQTLAGGWSVPADLAGIVERVGVARLDEALARLLDGREPAHGALAALGADAGAVGALYERGRYYRLRPRLVPKLSARTLGVDLFD
jgi:hypothetical protein